MNYQPPPIRNVNIERYVTPFREVSSLSCIVAADDGFLYIAKFRGAGQGTKALIADLIGAELARAAGRFRWLTAHRSTVVQPSKVHPGLCEDPAEMLERLFRDMVL